MANKQPSNPLATGNVASVSQPPWWRLPIVWMVIAGPAIVVVASFVTLGLALTHVDPVLDTTKDQVAKTSNQAPAMLGRNHAAEAAQQPADK
jgi:hypothetical protein